MSTYCRLTPSAGLLELCPQALVNAKPVIYNEEMPTNYLSESGILFPLFHPKTFFFMKGVNKIDVCSTNVFRAMSSNNLDGAVYSMVNSYDIRFKL